MGAKSESETRFVVVGYKQERKGLLDRLLGRKTIPLSRQNLTAEEAQKLAELQEKRYPEYEIGIETIDTDLSDRN